MEFEKQKRQRLEHVDLSRKGSVDTALLESVTLINSWPNYFTTSSCSGRIILFENSSSRVQKKGCRWLHVTHECCSLQDLDVALKDISDEAVFKFEPMVMHIQCRSLKDAQQMHQIAVASGFRNSGITVGTKGKIIVAVRSTHSLEVPLSCKGEVLVSEKHLQYLVQSANNKMQENSLRIERFYQNLQEMSHKASVPKYKTERETKKNKTHRVESLTEAKERESPNYPDDLEENDSLSLFMFENT